jgi:hypothetical protein
MSSGRIWAQTLSKLWLIFVNSPTTYQTQHYPHGPDDHLNTIHYHHLDMARDDGMDEHGIDWLLGCHLVGFGLKSWANCG